MKYSKSQFRSEYYKLWESGLLLPYPNNASVYSVKYRKNHFDQYSRVTLKAVSVSDALERACYAITYASPWRPEDIDLHAVYDSEENLLWIDEPYYNQVQKHGEFRGMDRRSFLTLFGTTSAAILFGLRPRAVNAATTSVAVSGTLSGFSGEQLYTTPGSYNWTVPAGVTSICLVCIGAGAPLTGSNNASGGGLSYVNGVSVTPGEVLNTNAATNSGTENAVTRYSSYVKRSSTSLVEASSGWNITGGSPIVGTGGNGGNGNFGWGGPGGAGGYSGNGGAGGSDQSANGQAGNGGGGAGGSGRGGGGGVSLFGVGSNGSPSSATYSGTGADYYHDWKRGGGGGGSGGTSGGDGTFVNYIDGNGDPSTRLIGGNGGSYGGGAATTANGSATAVSGSGAVRIIWGSGRSFPSNAT